MKQLLLTLFLSLSLVAPSQAFDWSSIFTRVNLSVAQLFHARGNCTAFSINREQHYYLTAAHCIGEDMQLWKETTTGTGMQHTFEVTTVLKVSKELDLAVLEATEGLLAMERGRDQAKGKEVASIGYAFGEPEPFLIASNVASIKTARAYALTRLIIFKDNQDIPGMSGGPVIDTKGRLVGMVQQGVTSNGQVTNIAYGTSISAIYNFAKSYWRN